MKVDKDGNMFAAGPGGILVFSPDAKLLGVIATGVRTSNCNWGDDGSTLYIAAKEPDAHQDEDEGQSLGQELVRSRLAATRSGALGRRRSAPRRG